MAQGIPGRLSLFSSLRASEREMASLDESPRTPCPRPTRDTGIVIAESARNVFGEADIVPAVSILEHINPIAQRAQKELVAGVGLIRLCLTPWGLTFGQSVSLRSARTYDPASAGL